MRHILLSLRKAYKLKNDAGINKVTRYKAKEAKAVKNVAQNTKHIENIIYVNSCLVESQGGQKDNFI